MTDREKRLEIVREAVEVVRASKKKVDFLTILWGIEDFLKGETPSE